MVGSLDNVTWQALTAILTLMGLIASGLLWRMRGAASGLRMLAIALLPMAAYLTGTLRLLWEIGDAVVSWAVRFAFSPFVWLGIVVAGVSAVLFTVSSAMRRRGLGTRRLLTSSSHAPAKQKSESEPESDDIEEILRRHGIS